LAPSYRHFAVFDSFASLKLPIIRYSCHKKYPKDGISAYNGKRDLYNVFKKNGRMKKELVLFVLFGFSLQKCDVLVSFPTKM
jgi:hypothetical protein